MNLKIFRRAPNRKRKATREFRVGGRDLSLRGKLREALLERSLGFDIGISGIGLMSAFVDLSETAPTLAITSRTLML